MSTRDAVIVEAVRTPVGKRNGSLMSFHSADLSAVVLRALAERSGIDTALVDDVIWGCVSQVGAQAFNIGRNSVLAAGWPESVPGTTVDRQCGSSQQAVHFAAAGLVAGQYDVAVAGGVEIMSAVPMFSNAAPDLGVGKPYAQSIHDRYQVDTFNQGIGAEMIADQYGFSRADMDAFAAESHRRMAAAVDAGAFDGQLAPVDLPDGGQLTADEGLRRGTTVESLAGLKTVFREDGGVTAGNASQISDGSAALLLMTSEKAAQLGLKPLARVHTAVVAGSDPVIMLTGPIPATHKALEKSGLSLSDIGVFEVNEAFASVPMAWHKEFPVPDEQLNPNGGAIALGHPLGASGARIMTTMVHHMRDKGIKYGLQTMCEGGGMANATILELVD